MQQRAEPTEDGRVSQVLWKAVVTEACASQGCRSENMSTVSDLPLSIVAASRGDAEENRGLVYGRGAHLPDS